jgi:APA family basic amino acid/polyamine antiporter
MSTAPDKPASGPGEIREREEQTGARNSLGLSGATALIVGSIIGVGIFNLPASLASYGPISLIAMGLTTIGALALAYMFASPTRPSGHPAVIGSLEQLSSMLAGTRISVQAERMETR